MRTGIVVLNWNGYQDTRECLLSLLAVERADVLVVDNGSVDGSGRQLSAEFPDVPFLFSESNRGFAGGNNLGLQYWFSRGYDAVLLLNNDTVIRQPFVSRLETLIRELPAVGVLGPVVADFARPDTVQSYGGRANLWTCRFDFIAAGEPLDQARGVAEVGYVLGAAFMIPRHTYDRVGLLDERFFPAYIEEVDYCVRARRHNLRSYVTDEVAVWHKGGRSGGDLPTRFKRLMRNRWLFACKHARVYHWPSFAVIWAAHYAWRTWIRPL